MQKILLGALTGALLAGLALAQDPAGEPRQLRLDLLRPAAASALTAFFSAATSSGAADCDAYEVTIDSRMGTVARLEVATAGSQAAAIAPLAEVDPTAAGAAQPLADAVLGRFGAMFGTADMKGALALQDAFDSQGARHVRYRQVVDGVEVVYAALYMHFSRDGRLLLAESTLSTLVPSGGWLVSEEDALAAARSYSKCSGRLPTSTDRVAPRWFSSADGRLHPVWRVDTSSQLPLAAIEAYVDAQSGAVLDAFNRLCTVNGSGMVFVPNPIVALQNPGLTDMGDSCYAQMMAARTSVTLENLDGSGTLTGTYVSTSASSVARANEPSLVFNYCRDQSFFNEVMVYHHLDRTQTWIQSLGFTNINNRRQIVDPHASCGTPNAFYNPANQQITFCRDGIDAAEDADVIIHEYGHSIHDNQVPGWGLCEEGGAMGEGFGDYISESANSGAPGSFQYGDLGDWFGVQASGSGSGTGLRTVLSGKVYPRDYAGEVHADGEIWSAALWDIRESLGRATTDAIVLQSHFFLSPAADFMDGGAAIIMADQTLNGGANFAVLDQALRSRGLYFPQDGFEPNETEAAARALNCGGNPNLVVAGGDIDWFTFSVQGNGGWLTMYHHAVSPSGSTTCIVPYDLEVRNPSGGILATTSVGGTNQSIDLSGAAAGTYKVRVAGNSGARFAYDLDYVPVNDGSSTFTGTCGDCNNDGQVNILDGLTAAQAAAGLVTPPNPAACDVDFSTVVNILDALLIAQVAAGLPATLNCAGGVCGQGNARPISCGQMVSDAISQGTAPLGAALTIPGTAHFYRLTGIPPGTSTITISTTGTGDMDLYLARPGALPGATNANRYPTSAEMRSTGPTAVENVTLGAASIYSPSDWHGGPLAFVISAFTPGSYTVTVTCN